MREKILIAFILIIMSVVSEQHGYASCTDPYETSWRTDTGKTVLLRRLANDKRRYENQDLQTNPGDDVYDGIPDCPDPVFGGPNSNPRLDPHWTLTNEELYSPAIPKGFSISTTDPGTIKFLFKNIAQRIKLRLVQ